MSETKMMSEILAAAADCPAPVYVWEDEAADAVSVLSDAWRAVQAHRNGSRAAYRGAIIDALCATRYAYSQSERHMDARAESCYGAVWYAVSVLALAEYGDTFPDAWRAYWVAPVSAAEVNA